MLTSMLRSLAVTAAVVLGTLGLTAGTAAAKPVPRTVTYNQTCLPASAYNGSIPAGDEECYVNAIATGPAYIHVSSSAVRHVTVRYAYCVNFGPGNGDPGSEVVTVRPPAVIEIAHPFCASNGGFPRGYISAGIVLPAREAARTQLWVTSPRK